MQQGTFNHIDALGKRLSLVLNCPVSWPGNDKNMFVCKCGIQFPVYRLGGSDDWAWVTEKHSKGRVHR